MGELVGALDQGTTSTRFVIVDASGRVVAHHQLSHRQILEHPGWVEHDPDELVDHSIVAIECALSAAGCTAADLAGIGIANQRETTVVWERATGQPVAPAIVWQDGRSAGRVRELVESGATAELRARTGLPPTTYASATKLEWLLDHVPDARRRAARGELCFGTIDSFLISRLTGAHVTDATNASRTMLMDLATCRWDPALLERFGVPAEMLPTIGPSTRAPGELVWEQPPGGGAVSITGIFGDQQAALFGQGCRVPGEAKLTYGTGGFLLVHTGTNPVPSRHGLLSTVAAWLDGAQPTYALEGAVAEAGSAVAWLRELLQLADSADETEALARSVADTEGCYVVPAFSGLFAPYWRPDARGVIVGLTRAHGRAHLIRATLEAVAHQCADIVDAIEDDLGSRLEELRVDGGMVANTLLLELQADLTGIPVVRASDPETTARGAALAAGLGAGLWASEADLPVMAGDPMGRVLPQIDDGERAKRRANWARAVERSLDWVVEK
jgi:glycerol kinase